MGGKPICAHISLIKSSLKGVRSHQIGSIDLIVPVIVDNKFAALGAPKSFKEKQQTV